MFNFLHKEERLDDIGIIAQYIALPPLVYKLMNVLINFVFRAERENWQQWPQSERYRTQDFMNIIFYVDLETELLVIYII